MSTKTEQQLIHDVMKSGEQMGIESVAFHSAAADKLGLDVSSMKAIGLLRQRGRMTTGEIAQLTGLTPGAVTALVRRLASKGYVIRQHDSADARKVYIMLVQARVERIDAVYASLMRSITGLLSSFSVDELHLILAYQQQMAGLMQRETMAIAVGD